MAKIELTFKELVELFEEQMDLLKTHCKSYDSGKTSIYKDIAVKLRLLLRETKNQKSLLKQLNIDDFPFINSGIPYDPDNLLPTSALLLTCFDENGWSYKPCYDRQITKESFDYWWSKQIILTDINNDKFTREEIVLNIADTFGGAHVDPQIKVPFYNITINNSIGINLQGLSAEFSMIGDTISSDFDAINTPIPPSLRQIAEELIRTIESTIKIIKEGDSVRIVID